MSNVPTRLRVEHLDEALGIRTTAPRLSWRLPDGARAQEAYRITADNGWDTGWVGSGQSLLVPYAGPPPSASTSPTTSAASTRPSASSTSRSQLSRRCKSARVVERCNWGQSHDSVDPPPLRHGG